MPILICRVAWMPSYQSDDELAIGGGSYVDEGNLPHESLNFLPIADTYYGFVQNRGQQVRLENLGAQPEDETTSGVLVVFCAVNPESTEFQVTGWYSDATVHRHSIERPGDTLRRRVHFTSTSARLIQTSTRCFKIPRAQDNPSSPIGGLGNRNIWYGLNEERAADFREMLGAYIGAPNLTQTPQEVVESRKRRISERLERQGAYRQFIRSMGYRCEACEWFIEEDQQEVWGSSFELHHLTPFRELRVNETRVVTVEEFAVLCASCHRAIHRTDFVSDVKAFAALHIRT